MLINMKNFKTFYEVQTASHPKEIIQPPHQPPPPPPLPIRQKLTTSLEQRFSYRDTQNYIDISFQSA